MRSRVMNRIGSGGELCWDVIAEKVEVEVESGGKWKESVSVIVIETSPV